METIKNELKKTLDVWMNKDTWKRRSKLLRQLIVYMLIACIMIVIFPMPTKCRIENYGAYNLASDISIEAKTIRDCYPPSRAEFWQNPQWSFEFRWLFIPTLDSILRSGPTRSIVNIHLSFPVDLENLSNLVGASQNIFVGKVAEQTGNKVTQVGPRTQYTVEVATNIKGYLSGIVTVDMMGGYENGQLITVESDDPENFLLKPGFSYLFSTRYNEQENWHTLIAHPNARKLLSDDSSATMEDLRTIAKKDEKVQRLQLDYPNEILVDADIANNNVDNSFLSLPPKSKAAAQSRADEAKASLAATKPQ